MNSTAAPWRYRFFVVCSFLLLLLSVSACTSVKKISDYKLADKPETAAKNIEKSLNYLLSESDSADYRSQLYDSIAFLAVKFNLKTANPALTAKIKNALLIETRKVSVNKKVPASDILYLRRLAVAKLGELGELDLLLKLVEDIKAADAQIAATAFTSIFDLGAELKQDPDRIMAVFQALDNAQRTADLSQDDKDLFAVQLTYFNEKFLDIDTCTTLLSRKQSLDPGNETLMIRLLDWNYTLLHNLDSLPAPPDSDSISRNLASIAAVGFPSGGDGKAALPRKSRALLSVVAPLFALGQTLDKAMPTESVKDIDLDYSLEAFSFFSAKPYPTDGQEKADESKGIPAGNKRAVLTKVMKLATAASSPEVPKQYRDAAYGTLIEIAPLEFARTVAQRASLARNDQKSALEAISLLKAAIALNPVIADKELSGQLKAELAGFASSPTIEVLDAATFLLLDDAPEKLLIGLESAIDSMDKIEADIFTRLSETYMTVLHKLKKKPAAAKGSLDIPRFSALLAKSSGTTRKKLIRFVVDHDPDAVIRFFHTVLSKNRLIKNNHDNVFFAEALADYVLKNMPKLNDDLMRTAVNDLRDFISTEQEEESALHIACMLIEITHPFSNEALKELMASAGGRFETLHAVLDAAVRRRS